MIIEWQWSKAQQMAESSAALKLSVNYNKREKKIRKKK